MRKDIGKWDCSTNCITGKDPWNILSTDFEPGRINGKEPYSIKTIQVDADQCGPVSNDATAAARTAIQQMKRIPPIRNVIFNPPATIVLWDDGTKTVVKCHDGEFSEEFGFAMAVMRKLYGTRSGFLAQIRNAYRPYLTAKGKRKASDEPSKDQDLTL